jgi:tetratricopeptide (TPR) repeat protein
VFFPTSLRFHPIMAALVALAFLPFAVSRQGAATEPSTEIERLLQTAQQALSAGHWDDAARALTTAEKLPANADLQGRIAQFRRDLFMVVRLDEIRCEYPVNRKGFNRDAVSADYRKAFREYGLDPEKAMPEEMKQHARTSLIRSHLIAALDDWALIVASENMATACQLLDVASMLDESPLRREVRAAMLASDRQHLLKLTMDADVKALTPSTVLLLAAGLDGMDATAAKLKLLRRGQRCYPNDFSINLAIGWELSEENPLAIGGTAPERQPALDEEAVRCFRAAIALRPNSADARLGLSYVLISLQCFSEAETAAREAVRLQPNWDQAHLILSVALSFQEKYVPAETACREAVRLNADKTESQCLLGRLLQAQEKWSDAETALCRALKRKKDDPVLNALLGGILADAGKYQEAEMQLREALGLNQDPGNLWALQCYLGGVLLKLQRWAEAEAVLQAAIHLKKGGDLYSNLAWAMLNQRRTIEAEVASREAIRLNPRALIAQYILGRALLDQKRFSEAETALREVL